MTGDLIQYLRKFGTPVDMKQDRSFWVDRGDRFWIVESGSVDIFSAPMHGDLQIGRRSRLLSLQAGDAIFPLIPPGEDSTLRFLAAPGPDTRALSISLSELEAFRDDPTLTAALAEAAEAWASGLMSELAFDRLTPEHCKQIGQGETLCLETGEALQSAIPNAWILQLDGTTRFMGREDLDVIRHGNYAPLLSGAWLESVGKCQVRSCRLVDLLKQGSSPKQCLSVFHNLVYGLVRIERAQQDNRDQVHLLSSTDQDHFLEQSALTHLASVLGEVDTVYESASPDTLLRACQLIGRAQGIKVLSPSSFSTAASLEEGLRLIAGASKFRTRKVILKGAWWKDNYGPLLGNLSDSGRPVGLIPDHSGRYQLHDPDTGEKTSVDSSISKSLSASVFMFYKPFPEGSLTPWSIFLFGLSGCRHDIRLILLLAAGSGMLGAIIPVATGILYDSVIPSANRTLLLQMVAGLTVGALVGGIFQLVQGLAELKFLGRMEANVEAAIWDRLLNLPAVFFRRFSSGDLANRAMTIYQIQQIISGAVMTSLLSGIFCAFNVSLLFYYDSSLALLALAILLVAVITMLVLYRMQLRYLRPQLDLGGKISDFNVQILNSIAKLRANAAEMRAFHRWSQIYSQYKTLNVKYRKLSVVTSIFQAILPLVATLAIFASLAAKWNPDDPTIQTGQFLAFTAALTAVIMAVMTSVKEFTAVFSVVPMYERMKPIISQEPETQTGQRDPGKLTGLIEMAHVNFRYKSDGPLILKDVSLKADPGEFVALVGPSGSGKSTILRLLIQFEIPESGSIFYDGQRLAELDIQTFRRQLGVVLQGGRLLSGNIFECITGGLPLTAEEAWEAAAMASLDRDIQAMPMGMHTMIGEGGSVLSGGQRQRLLIARAIVKKPRIVFFDEATSALDNVSQAQVSKSLEDLKATRIVIAHRLSTIRNADRIYVLVRGQVVESGSYDELMANRGVFSELAKRQIA